MTRHALTATIALACLAPLPSLQAQDAATTQRLFESGRFQQVVEAAAPEAPPDVLFLAGQSQQRLNNVEGASAIYARLAARPEADPWHHVGRSAELLLANDTDGALATAQQAVAANGALLEAQYQLGLVHAKRLEWAPAAAAFDRASEIDPAFAYAHYYGGLAYYRSGRPDRMAIHFEQFLKVAPNAPERPEVLQIMRTVRGR